VNQKNAITCVPIEPNSIYSFDSMTKLLGLARNTLRREVRLGRLKYAIRARKRWLRGQWILDWLEAGVVDVHDRTPRRESDAP
jgi:hypothetical protein